MKKQLRNSKGQYSRASKTSEFGFVNLATYTQALKLKRLTVAIILNMAKIITTFSSLSTVTMVAQQTMQQLMVSVKQFMEKV